MERVLEGGSTRDIFVDPTTILLCRNNTAAYYDTQKVKTHGYRIGYFILYTLSARQFVQLREYNLPEYRIIYDLKWLHGHAI
jgi:hypothetical protein